MNFLIMLITPMASPEIDAGQFRRLIEGSHAMMRDVTFVYEGGLKGRGEGSADTDSQFQGMYSFRDDGAVLLDLFRRAPGNDVPGSREIRAILDGRLERLRLVPDLAFSELTTGVGVPGVLNSPGSAERILYYWFLLTLEDPGRHGYEFLGWKTVDGRRCLCVQIATVPDAERAQWDEARLPTFRFWIDMERGGHPLRVEYRYGPNLVMRTDIRLAQVPFRDGRRVWFPAGGETNSFLGTSEDYQDVYHRRPLSTETYAVVDGSVRFNQGLEDDYFTAERETTEFADPELARLQRELNAVEPEERPRLPTDPESVRRRLEERLADAERQSELLRASSAARVSRSWMPIGQLAFITVGLVLIVSALYWRRRFG